MLKESNIFEVFTEQSKKEYVDREGKCWTAVPRLTILGAGYMKSALLVHEMLRDKTENSLMGFCPVKCILSNPLIKSFSSLA